MQKKLVLMIIVAIFITSLFVNGAYSQANSNIPSNETNEEVLESPEDIINIIGNDKIREEFLEEKKTEILEQTTFGKILKKRENLFKCHDPVFNIILGIGFTISWFFTLTLIIYIILIKLLYDLTHIINIYIESKKKKYIKGIILASWIIFISSVRIEKSMATYLIETASNIEETIGKYVYFFTILILLLSILLLSSQIKQITKKKILERNAKEGKEESRKNKKEIIKIESQKLKEEQEKQEEEELKERARRDLEGIENI